MLYGFYLLFINLGGKQVLVSLFKKKEKDTGLYLC